MNQVCLRHFLKSIFDFLCVFTATFVLIHVIICYYRFALQHFTTNLFMDGTLCDTVYSAGHL